MGKGYLYTLEVLIAASLIFVALAMAYKSAPLKPEMQLSSIKIAGTDALDYLDRKGDLRQWVFYGNESVIESELRVIIPRSIDFEASVGLECDTRNVPENRTIVSVVHYFSGLKDRYSAKKICLFMWEEY